MSWAYLDAEYKEFLTTDDDGIDSDGNTSELLDDSHLKDMAYAPRHTVDLGVEYAFEPFAFGQLIANVNCHWQDEQFSSSNGKVWVDDHDLLNSRLSLVDIPVGQGGAGVALWGRNLDNEDYVILAADLDAFVGNVFGEPRSYGVDFVYEY